MKIILEGCDGTGKTTLAKILADRYGLDICHCTSKDPADYDFYKNTARKENIIWDRHTLGELIYPSIFNRKQQISIEDAKRVIDCVKENGGVVLVLIEDDNIIRDRLLARSIPENFEIFANISWINDRFIHFAELFGIPVINTSKMTIEEIFELVEKESKLY